MDQWRQYLPVTTRCTYPALNTGDEVNTLLGALHRAYKRSIPADDPPGNAQEP